jgi:aminoglycoside phosphotransferase (APT) family kinase protein
VVVEPLDLLRARHPELDLRDVRTIEDGWDSLVLEIDGYVFRFPRRPEVREWVEREIALLPELAPTLPVEVPAFEFIEDGATYVGYRKLEGWPATSELRQEAGGDLGRLLVALHAFPVERACELGVPFFDSAAWRAHFERFCADLRARVLPLLEPSERERAETLFSQVSSLDFEPTLVHGDLGPEHVLCRDGRVVGVIDWSDARIGDPALDLSWCLNGTAAAASSAVALVYGVDEDTRERSLFYHRLGPWHEVVYGLETGQDRFVVSGLEGVRSRLPD